MPLAGPGGLADAKADLGTGGMHRHTSWFGVRSKSLERRAVRLGSALSCVRVVALCADHDPVLVDDDVICVFERRGLDRLLLDHARRAILAALLAATRRSSRATAFFAFTSRR